MGLDVEDSSPWANPDAWAREDLVGVLVREGINHRDAEIFYDAKVAKVKQKDLAREHAFSGGRVAQIVQEVAEAVDPKRLRELLGR